MTDPSLFEQLESIVASDDFPVQSSNLIENWSSYEGGFEGVESILRFIEANPDIDFGQPGPLVHYAERFYGHGYEEKLVESIERRPTRHTVWMLNRVLNGTKRSELQKRYVDVLAQARLNPLTNHDVRQQIDHFLHRLST